MKEYGWRTVAENELEQRVAEENGIISKCVSKLECNPDFKELMDARSKNGRLLQRGASGILIDMELKFAKLNIPKVLIKGEYSSEGGMFLYNKLMEYFNRESGESSEVYGFYRNYDGDRVIQIFAVKKELSIEDIKDSLQKAVDKKMGYFPSRKGQIDELDYLQVYGNLKYRWEQEIWDGLTQEK